MLKNSKIYVAGHTGLVGSAIKRKLELEGCTNIICRTHQELDLINQDAVNKFFKEEKPEYVFLSAAKVGGIQANNTYPAEFIYQNLMIQNNILHSAHENGVVKLMFLGSSCIYPKFADQPMKEEYLLTGELEPTNEGYALAKISGIQLCKAYRKQYGSNFISVMPTNLYGPNDNYHPENSHVLPAFIRRFHEAKIKNLKEVTCWGSGSPFREFLYIDDLADACIHLMRNYNDSQHVNIGTGEDISLKDLADLISGVVGYTGKILWDTSKPDGTPKKLLDVSKLKTLGWKYETKLKDGIVSVYKDYVKNLES